MCVLYRKHVEVSADEIRVLLNWDGSVPYGGNGALGFCLFKLAARTTVNGFTKFDSSRSYLLDPATKIVSGLPGCGKDGRLLTKVEDGADTKDR